jgi:chromosome segregation ATPase
LVEENHTLLATIERCTEDLRAGEALIVALQAQLRDKEKELQQAATKLDSEVRRMTTAHTLELRNLKQETMHKVPWLVTP